MDYIRPRQDGLYSDSSRTRQREGSSISSQWTRWSGIRAGKNCALSAINAFWHPYPIKELSWPCSPSLARATRRSSGSDQAGCPVWSKIQVNMMAHVICDIGYALSIMANHISRMAAAISCRKLRHGPVTVCQDTCDAPDSTKTRTFPAHGKSHMQYQNCNIGYAHSETPRRPFKIGNPISHIMPQTCVMLHQLSFMANATCSISYP